jgi:hypothetical protein
VRERATDHCGRSFDAQTWAGGEGLVSGPARFLQHEVEADVHAVATGDWALAEGSSRVPKAKSVAARGSSPKLI